MKFPCPHCGAEESLTDREVGEIKPIIPPEFQADFDKDFNLMNQSPVTQPKPTYDTPPSSLKTSTNLPLEFLFPPPIPDASLSPTEQKLYLQLSLEFRIILDRANSYEEGLRNWTLILPDRLAQYGLSKDYWDRIAALGDRDPKIQQVLKWLIRKVFS